MRLLIVVLAVFVLIVALVLLPLWPQMKSRRRQDEAEGYQPSETVDRSHRPPPVPEPGEAGGSGGRDVPPGSRRDRERHGKP